MIFNLIFTILAAVIGVFECAIFTILCFSKDTFVKKIVGMFIIGAVVCAALTVALAVVGLVHVINF